MNDVLRIAHLNDHPDNPIGEGVQKPGQTLACCVNLANVVILVLKTGKLTNPIETRAE